MGKKKTAKKNFQKGLPHPTRGEKKKKKKPSSQCSKLLFIMCVHPLVWVMGHSIHSYLPPFISYKGWG